MSLLEEVEKKMKKTVEHFQQELKQIRTGRASVSVVENVPVEAYDTVLILKNVATISIPETRQILITPFDAQSTGSIKKGIEKANLNLTPVIDGNNIRIVIPPPTGEDRKKYAKLAKEKAEKTKVTIRQERQDGNKALKEQKNNKEISEDIVKSLEKKIQELTNSYCQQIDAALGEKEKEILTV